MKLVLVIAMTFACACGGPQQSTETLVESVRSFNDGVRWQRYEVAATRLPATERSRFVDDMDERATDIRIIDYEVIRIDTRGSREARVHVKLSWYHNDEQVLRETHTIQTWERHGKAWFMMDEALLRGAAMPGLADRTSEPSARAP